MTAQIIISDIVIHQDSDGRYSINDLHKASGSEQRHQPRYWLDIQQTKELIEVIANSEISLFQPTHTIRGCRGGTYVCKELVYSYAMWISAAFALKVIRTYDAMMTASLPAPKTTVTERTPLRDAVNLLVSKRALPYDQAYAIIHQRFAVSSIEELEPELLPAAVEYIHRLALEGELLPRESLSATVLPIFPTGHPFRYVTDVDERGTVISMSILREDEFISNIDSHTEMLRRMGMIVIYHQKLSDIPAAQIANLCNEARKEETHWNKVYSR